MTVVGLPPTARLRFPADARGGSPAESRRATLTYGAYQILGEMLGKY